MHWSDEIAQQIIRKKPNQEVYTCAAGISPSGSVHIGNFRDIATSWFVVKALERAGKKAKLLFSWDELDRLRKIPVNVVKVNDDMEKYIGLPYVDVPNPFDTDDESYADYFEKEFFESIKPFNIEMDSRYQAKMYRTGVYDDDIIMCLHKRKKIFDILDRFRTQESTEEERNNYYPVSIYCENCGKDTTTITSLTEDCINAEYKCECGHNGHFTFGENHNCKLAWKVDWPMRWKYEKVDFEPGGKDHATVGGSYDAASAIAEEIFSIKAPVFQGYEFIGIKGSTGKMSGSTGLNLTPKTLLQIYQPEVILWLYSKSEPTKAFDFCFDDGILKQYFEFDRMYNKFLDGSANEYEDVIIKNCLVSNKKIKTVPMSLLVQLGSIVNFNIPMLETVFEKIGTSYKYEDFKERLNLARYWLENCAPAGTENKLRQTRNWDVYNELTDDEKKEIELIYNYLRDSNYTLDELNTKLYEISKEVFGADSPYLKKLQGEFFKCVYQLLIDKEKGPRLYLFLYAIDKESFLNLLDFSYPQTEEEIEIDKKAKEIVEEDDIPKIEYGEPDPIKDFTGLVGYDVFESLDLRVCKIEKCQEIRKSHDCYKLTLNDGKGKRVIASSIKKYYSPKQLEGKKIVVMVNLEPKSICGIKSEGMLLAATNNACGCQLVFMDDIVPEGTRIG